MKNKTLLKFLSAFLTIIMLLCSAPLSCVVGLKIPEIKLSEWNPLDFSVKSNAATYSGSCGDNMYWSLDAKTGVLNITGTGEMDNYYDEYAPWYSNRDYIKTIKIANGITSMGEWAFYDCTSITDVYYAGDIESWCNISFDDHTSNPILYTENFYINNALVKEIVIPDTITEIKNYAFCGFGGMTSVTIPDSVTSIGYSAFTSCTSLTSITIPDSVTSIEEDAFYNTAYYNDLTNWENDVLYICNHLISAQDTLSGSYIIKQGTKTIAGNAFAGCFGLTAIEIPDSVISIGDYTFLSCGNLTSVTIPNNVTSIDYGAFYNCNSLASITIPDSVTSIRADAFYNTAYYNDSTNWENDVLYICNHLISARDTLSGSYIIKQGTKTIADDAFYSCVGLTAIEIPDSVTYIGSDAFYHCTSLTSVTIPDNVMSIGDGTFSKCESLTSVAIPEGVTSIGWHAFEGCHSLNLVTIPDSVTSIGYGAFYYCTSLTSVTIGNSVTSIGDWAFYHCMSLTSVTIPDSVTTIGDYAFGWCTNLTSVTIPDSVTSIGDYAFDWCTSLTDIHFDGTKAKWDAISIGEGNEYLTDTNIHLGTEPTTPAPTEINFEQSNYTVNYKGSIKVTATPNAETDKKINYVIGDSTVATIDDEGNITTVGPGTATVVATIEGTDISDTCTITVSYTWWQWLIMIFLFGWIWY